MAPAQRSIVVVVLALASACGGKILVEASDGSTAVAAADPEAATVPNPAPSSSASPSPSIGEACTKICARDGMCGARTDACEERCLAKASAGCGASEWLRCYAERLDGCLALPPACEPAYCAWAACAGEPVPDYCR